MTHNRLSDLQDSRIVWFAVLERAYRDHDFEAIRRATRELQRLGVVVRFHALRPAGAGL